MLDSQNNLFSAPDERVCPLWPFLYCLMFDWLLTGKNEVAVFFSYCSQTRAGSLPGPCFPFYSPALHQRDFKTVPEFKWWMNISNINLWGFKWWLHLCKQSLKCGLSFPVPLDFNLWFSTCVLSSFLKLSVWVRISSYPSGYFGLPHGWLWDSSISSPPRGFGLRWSRVGPVSGKEPLHFCK